MAYRERRECAVCYPFPRMEAASAHFSHPSDRRIQRQLCQDHLRRSDSICSFFPLKTPQISTAGYSVTLAKVCVFFVCRILVLTGSRGRYGNAGVAEKFLLFGLVCGVKADYIVSQCFLRWRKTFFLRIP